MGSRCPAEMIAFLCLFAAAQATALLGKATAVNEALNEKNRPVTKVVNLAREIPVRAVPEPVHRYIATGIPPRAQVVYQHND